MASAVVVLPDPGFSDEPELFAFSDIEVHAVNSAYRPGADVEIDAQIAYRKDSVRHYRLCLNRGLAHLSRPAAIRYREIKIHATRRIGGPYHHHQLLITAP